jgi:hypothetical protein
VRRADDPRVRSALTPWLVWCAPLVPLIVIATTSGTLLSLLAAAGLMLVALCAGLPIATRAWGASPLERAVLAFGIGLGLEALAGAVLAASGNLHSGPVFLAAAALVVSGLVLARRDGLKPPAAPPRGALTIAIIVLAVTPFVPPPETKFDAVWYHLPLAAAMARSGDLEPLPNLVQSYYPGLAELLSAMAILLSSLEAAKYVHFAVGLVVVGAVGALGTRLAGSRAGLLAATAWLTIPLALWEMASAYVDLFAALFAALALLTAARWVERRLIGDAVLCGIFVGLGFGAKLMFAFVAAPLLFAIALVGLRKRADIAHLLVGVGLAALVASPWYLRSFALTGNPVFPFLNATFRSPHWEPVNYVEYIPRPSSLVDVGLLPVHLTLGSYCPEAPLPMPCLGLIPVLALAAVIAAVLRRDSGVSAMLALFVAFATGFWLVLPVDRYLLPVLTGACAMLGALGASVLTRAAMPYRRAMQLFIAANAVAAIAFFGVLQSTLRDPFPWRVDLGLETREAFLARHLASYPVIRWMDAHVPADEIALVLPHMDLALAYTSRAIYPASLTLEGRQVLAAADGSEALARLREYGFRYVIIDLDRSAVATALSSPSVLGRDLRLVYAASPTLGLYEVVP